MVERIRVLRRQIGRPEWLSNLWPMYVDKRRCIVAVDYRFELEPEIMNMMVDLKTNTLRISLKKGGVFRVFGVGDYIGPDDIWSLITRGQVRRKGFGNGNGKPPGW